jgi:predicted TIM-barrel fold metal-dependent hydrolase
LIHYLLYAVAEKLGIPILFHTGSSIFKNSRIKYGNPILYDDVAIDFPELKIVMAHGGRGPWYEEAALMVRLLTYFPDLERFADKFIFGTD